MSNSEIREGSAPNFCPPSEEGITLIFTDENNDEINLEFLGMLIEDDLEYGFFFQVDDQNPALSSGEVIILQVLEIDDEGIPTDFELVEDQALLEHLYEAFKIATKDLYRFE